MDFLKRFQKQPIHVRKLILWIIVIIVAFILGSWWVYSSLLKIKEFSKEGLIKGVNLPAFGEELKKLPKIEIPDYTDDKEFEILKKEIEKAAESLEETEEGSNEK